MAQARGVHDLAPVSNKSSAPEPVTAGLVNTVANGTSSPTTAARILPASQQIAGQKRKRVPEKKFYAVKEGRTPGIYDTWKDCLNQVRGHKGALFKAFPSHHEAQAFIEGKILSPTSTSPSGEQKFYAVQNGRVPGVYVDWPSAQAQIQGFRNPRHKKFATRAEAEQFVAAAKKPTAYDPAAGLGHDEEIHRLLVQNSAPGLITNGRYSPKDKQGVPYELGRGPLPPGAEDGFDPNLKLASNGEIVNRTEEEKKITKMVPKERDPVGMLRIYTDGSSLKNGQAGARAGVGVFFGPQHPQYEEPTPASSLASSPRRPLSSSSQTCSESPDHGISTHTVYSIDWRARGAAPLTKRPKLTWRYRNVSEALKGSKQTNQRAELTAILRALDIAPRHRDVTIYTDSKYSIDCVTNWYKNWEKNGWVNAKGKHVENRDLVQDIRERMEERDVLGKSTYFVWVKGHANDAGNIAADRLANQGALMSRGVDSSDDDASPLSEDEDEEEKEGSRANLSLTGRGKGQDVVLDDEVEESLRLMDQAMKEDVEKDKKAGRKPT